MSTDLYSGDTLPAPHGEIKSTALCIAIASDDWQTVGMQRPRRTHAEARARMREGILRLGNEQLAEVGAAGLSVREIARGLGVSSSAIYRHVADRDELLTLLIVDAVDDLAAAALDGTDESSPPAERLARLARGMRRWAVSNPARWALAYGSPVPGYAAPADRTTGPGTLVMSAFVGLLAIGEAPADARAREVSPALAAELAAGASELGIVGDLQRPVDAALAAAAVEAWVGLVGLVSAEIFEQLGAELAACGEELLERWIASTAARFRL